MSIALIRFGDAGYYRTTALLDPEIEEAAGAFARAETIPGAAPR